MLVVYMTIFSFISSAFSITIFSMEILNATIPYCFRANFALFFNNFVQHFFSLNLSAFSLFVIYMAIFPLSGIYAPRSLVILILLSIR